MSTFADNLIKALEVDMYGSKEDCAKHNLRNLLFKLGIKSANNNVLTIESLEAMLNSVYYSFGKPDSLMMDPKTLDKFKKLT